MIRCQRIKVENTTYNHNTTECALMKTFKKIALVSAIAAAPFAAHAGLTPMADSLMGNTTAQAGVTIEIDISGDGITVGEVEYIDEGSVLLQNINISNADITQKIDVVTDGSLVIETSAITDLTVNIGNIDNTGLVGSVNGASAVALSSIAGDVTEVVNDIYLKADMGLSTVTLVNLQNSGNAAAYGINQSFNNGTDTASSVATGSLAIKMESSIDINEMNIGLFGYTEKQANTKVASDLAASSGESTASYMDGDVLSAVAGASVVDASGKTAAEAADEYADGSAVQLTNVQFYDTKTDGTRINATMDQTIWAQGGSVAQGGGIYIAMGEIKGTLDIGAISIAKQSIGQVKISDINLSGMTQRIYGHP
jgi:hypothetical protein